MISKHHLCTKNRPSGEICTNRCPSRQDCKTTKIPFLIEALDILVSEIETGELDEIPYISFKSYCIAPESYINELAFMQDSEFEHPGITSAHCEYCDRSFLLTAEQKEKLKTDNFTKYYKTTYLYCCTSCREAHLKKLAVSKSTSTTSLKNHEYALVIHDADLSKRPKEREVHIITGNTRELRANALMEYLKSLTPVNGRRIMTSHDVQEFFLHKVSADNLKTSPGGAISAAWRTMKKCREMFDENITLIRINEKDIGIEYVNKVVLRADALYELLMSISVVEDKDYLTLNDVQMFLLNGVHDNICTLQDNSNVAAQATIKKCKQIHPTHISIFDIDENEKGIKFIK